MIYIVKKCVAYDGFSIACATNNLSFAKDVFDKESSKSDLIAGHEWTELVCIDGQKHYEYAAGDIMKTTRAEG